MTPAPSGVPGSAVLLMGVVNATPDSFSDGGRYAAVEAAVAQGLQLVADGADVVDVGGEATNPQAAAVDAATELARVLPVIERLAAAGVRVSVDTTKAVVARAAVAAGATIVNDVSGGRFDPDMAAVLADTGAEYIAGHLRGRSLAEVFRGEAPASWREVADELVGQLAALTPATRARTWVDPGLGFGKGADPAGNLALIRHVGELARATGCPVVIGASRKRFLARTVGGAPSELALDAASVGAALAAVRCGARMLRAHNVALLRAALAVYTRI